MDVDNPALPSYDAAMRKAALLALLAWVGIAAASPHDVGLHGIVGQQPRKPSDWFLTIDLVDAGPGYLRATWTSGPTIGITMLKATAHWHRLRFGAALFELGADPMDGAMGPIPVPMFTPLYVGLDVVHVRRKTWFFTSSVPNVYAEVGASFHPITTLKGVLACDVDYYGFGLRVEGGGYLMRDTAGTEKVLYAGVLLRLLTLGFEL